MQAKQIARQHDAVTPWTVQRDKQVVAPRIGGEGCIANCMAKSADAAHEFSSYAAAGGICLIFLCRVVGLVFGHGLGLTLSNDDAG